MKTSLTKLSRRNRLTAALRVLGCLTAIVGASGFWVYRQARASVDEHLFSAGAQLMQLGEGTTSREQTLTLNGASFHMRSGSTHQTVDAVINHFRSACRNAAGGLQEQMFALPKRLRPLTPQPGALDGVLSRATEHRGYVACVDVGEKAMTLDTLMQRLQRFALTTDLSEVGDLRYVYVTGDTHSTSYFAIWTDGRLPLGAMFPEHGDAPGSDLANVPRPPSARRTLSAYGSEAASQVALYEQPSETPDTLAKAAESYVTSLRTAGFSPRRIGDARATDELWVAKRGDRTVSAHFIASGDGTIRTVLGDFL